MSVTDPVDGSDAPPAEYPASGLECTIDDDADPTRLTVHSADPEEVLTHWISVDADAAVDRREMR